MARENNFHVVEELKINKISCVNNSQKASVEPYLFTSLIIIILRHAYVGITHFGGKISTHEFHCHVQSSFSFSCSYEI